MGDIWCENPEDICVPFWMRRWNGKPTAITNSGYILRDSPAVDAPPGEWLELGIDVRELNWCVRRALSSYRTLLPKAALHFGFAIQAVEDADMPEGLLCDMHTYGVDMERDPRKIQG